MNEGLVGTFSFYVKEGFPLLIAIKSFLLLKIAEEKKNHTQ